MVNGESIFEVLSFIANEGFKVWDIIELVMIVCDERSMLAVYYIAVGTPFLLWLVEH